MAAHQTSARKEGSCCCPGSWVWSFYFWVGVSIV